MKDKTLDAIGSKVRVVKAVNDLVDREEKNSKQNSVKFHLNIKYINLFHRFLIQNKGSRNYVKSGTWINYAIFGSLDLFLFSFRLLVLTAKYSFVTDLNDLLATFTKARSDQEAV